MDAPAVLGILRLSFEREAEPLHHRTGRDVVGFVDADEPIESELLEPVANPRATGLGREATSAVLLAEPPAHFDGWQDLGKERRDR